MIKHKHRFRFFVEEGCIDNKVYYYCRCGNYVEKLIRNNNK